MTLYYYLTLTGLMKTKPNGLGMIEETDSVSHGLQDIDESGSVYNQNVEKDDISVATPFMALENKRYFKQSNLDPTEIFGVDVRKGKYDRNQTDVIGKIWRFFVRGIIAARMDPINLLRFARSLQIFLPFLSPYEAYLLGELIEDLDSDMDCSWELLGRCFENRNVSRILMKTFASKFDIFWHLSTQVKLSRAFDFLGKLPLFGFFAFPPTENFPSTKAFSYNAIVRSIKPGAWLIRFLTSNLEGSTVLDPKAPAQNGATAVSGFELANRNAKGTFFGRREVNTHRLELRLPTDGSIVRSFSTSPAETMLNNGVEHVLRCLVKHWRDLLKEENGNFAHQRMELLNPFETLRIHLPVVLTMLMNLRGRNIYDTKEVAPLMRTMQELNWMNAMEQDDVIDIENNRSEITALCSYARMSIVDQLISGEDPVGDVETVTPILDNICAGLVSRSQPLAQWIRLIRTALGDLAGEVSLNRDRNGFVTDIRIINRFERYKILAYLKPSYYWTTNREAKHLKLLIKYVQDGISIGYKICEGADWTTSTDRDLKAEIISHVKEQKLCRSVARALDKLASKEKRTLIECIRKKRTHLPITGMLLSRVVSLIKREKQRDVIDRRIALLSKGPEIEEVERFHWYWVTIEGVDRVYCAESKARSVLGLRDVETGKLKKVDHTSVRMKIRNYHPIAAAIVRAQKVFMTIEMDYLKRFSYDAFMEFGSLSNTAEEFSMRKDLLHLQMISQLQSYQIDDARRNILSEVKLSGLRKKGKTKAQNVLVVGGGPSGMMCAILTLHNVLLSGGELSIHQKRNGR